MIEKNIYYFLKPGEDNTDKVIELAKERAKELGIKYVITASSTGTTGLKVIRSIKDANIIVVGEEGDEYLEKIWERNSKTLHDLGVKTLRQTGERGKNELIVTNKHKNVSAQLIGDVLGLFSQGIKIGVVISVMAADAGLISTGQDIIAIAGTKSGADTAIVLRPAKMEEFFEIKIKEIICMPRE